MKARILWFAVTVGALFNTCFDRIVGATEEAVEREDDGI